MTKKTIPSPHNLDAECHVLGASIREPEALARARAILDADDFHEPKHQIIFAALCLMSDSRREIDLISLGDCLEKRNELQQAGTGFYLAELAANCPIAYSGQIGMGIRS
ncbi:MAG: DnaB-like helicase N-terminal domain-containing protein [Candidatus Omnitrophota bacterium]